MRNKTYFVFSIFLGSFFLVNSAFAHAVVKPATAGIGAFQTFTLGVPSEKDQPTVGVRLVLPEGLNYVSPNVKPGWQIEVKKTGDKAAEISWTGGNIPSGQRDDFIFSAQVPASAGSLHWKVYQTYKDGSIVSWDQDPSAPQPKTSDGKMDFSKVGPYSTTQVIDDLSFTSAPQKSWWDQNGQTASMVISLLALIISVIALNRKYK